MLIDGSLLASTIINYNVITQNNRKDIDIFLSEPVKLNAKYNYWGSPSGPKDSAFDHELVDFKPYWTGGE